MQWTEGLIENRRGRQLMQKPNAKTRSREEHLSSRSIRHSFWQKKDSLFITELRQHSDKKGYGFAVDAGDIFLVQLMETRDR